MTARFLVPTDLRVELAELGRRVLVLAPDHRRPEAFRVEKSEISSRLYAA